jgi:hypothetical protein
MGMLGELLGDSYLWEWLGKYFRIVKEPYLKYYIGCGGKITRGIPKN